MKNETLSNADLSIRIPIAGLSLVAVVGTPIVVLGVALTVAPLPLAAGLAGLVLLVLVLQHHRMHRLTRLASLHERSQQQQQNEQRGLQQRLADLEARIRDSAERRLQAQRGFEADLRRSRNNTAAALTQIVTMRDPVTGTHLERLTEYVGVLTEQLSQGERDRQVLTEEVRHSLPQASMLHDIGKVGIPDAILNKPARLTAEEFAVIQRHPSIGGRTLEKLCELDPEDIFLRMAHEIALHHHERWDGSGYPFSLAQEQIPLSARIVALADVYDALTSERPYKRAYSHEVTRGLIIAQSRSHFDPLVVEAFLAREVDFMRIREAHADISGAVRASRLAPVPTREENTTPAAASAPQETATPATATVSEAQPQLRVVSSAQ